jgi:hypothetical protein
LAVVDGPTEQPAAVADAGAGAGAEPLSAEHSLAQIYLVLHVAGGREHALANR